MYSAKRRAQAQSFASSSDDGEPSSSQQEEEEEEEAGVRLPSPRAEKRAEARALLASSEEEDGEVEVGKQAAAPGARTSPLRSAAGGGGGGHQSSVMDPLEEGVLALSLFVVRGGRDEGGTARTGAAQLQELHRITELIQGSFGGTGYALDPGDSPWRYQRRDLACEVA
jgi:hypothetical protein